MADILLNVDGTQKVFKNTVHLAANTESGGKAVYTEESETTTAYLLTDPTGEMPTYEGGIVRSFGGSEIFAAMNGAETAADGVVAYIANDEYGPMYFYAVKSVGLTKEMMFALMGGSNPDPDDDGTAVYVTLSAGWTKLVPDSMVKPMTTEEVQADLRKRGGIALDAFDVSGMDAYLAGMLVKSEIAVAKYAQANYAQIDPSKPDFVQNKIGGCIVPKLSVQTIEWDGEIGNRPYMMGMNAVQVYRGNFYKENLIGAKMTVVTQIGDADPTTQTQEITQDLVEEFEDYGYMQMVPTMIIIPTDFDIGVMALESGVYLGKYSYPQNGKTTTMYISKIEFPTDDGDVRIAPISNVWLSPNVVTGAPTNARFGGVKNPASYNTSNNDDSTAFVTADGLIKIPHGERIEKAVLYTSQSLTGDEKEQARTNLGVLGYAGYGKNSAYNVFTMDSGAASTISYFRNVFSIGDSNSIKSKTHSGSSSSIISMDRAFVFGSNNTCLRSGAFVVGSKNSVTTDGAVLFGTSNEAGSLAMSDTATLIGEHLIVGKTIAGMLSAPQLCIGKYNVESKSAFVVGSGTGDAARSNAFEIDYDGNATAAGNVEATAIILKSTTSGSTKKFKITVDDTGALTATEVTE